ncbi:MAG: 1-phosphofructokinase [Chloroflexi bacterium]|nr:1-phosphofructokinase [Chloroflexota bacterium]
MIYTVTLNPAVDKEMVVPQIVFDAVLRAGVTRLDFGGKGFNVSRMLKSLGADSTAVGFAGGKSGELLRDGLEGLGICTDFVWVGGETRTNVSIVTEPATHYVKANEPGPTISAEELAELRRKVGLLARPGDWWVLAGSLPPGVTTAVYAHLIADIQAVGGRVILDTSGEALGLGCAARPFLAKPNDVEAHQLTGLPVNNPAEIAAAAQAMQANGVDNVVVSLGKAGALLVDGRSVWRAISPTIQERNPIGAGDSMVGGLVYALSQGHSVAEALRWGIACGAATASMPGTAVGTRQLVDSLLPQVVLEDRTAVA